MGQNASVSIPSFNIIYQDIFNFKSLYKAVYEWLMENSLKDEFKTGDFIEQHYYHKESGGLYEISMVWNVSREYPPRSTNMFKIKIQIEYLLLAGRIEERIINGRKVKGEVGELNIFIRPELEVVNADWDESVLLRKMKNRVFRNYYKEQVEAAKAFTYTKTTELYNFIKSYLETKAAFMTQEQLFHQKHDSV